MCGPMSTKTKKKVLGAIIIFTNGYQITSDHFQKILKYWKILIFCAIRGIATKWKMLEVSNFGPKHTWPFPRPR